MRKVTIIGYSTPYYPAVHDEIRTALSDREVIFLEGVVGMLDIEVNETTVSSPRVNGCTVVGSVPVPRWVQDLHPVM